MRSNQGILALVLVAPMLFVALGVRAEEPAKGDTAVTATEVPFSGTIDENNPFGNMSAGFSGAIQGIGFTLKEDPSKQQYRYYFDSFEDGAKAGFMDKKGNAYSFKELKGKKVEGAAQKTADGKFLKVTSIKWKE